MEIQDKTNLGSVVEGHDVKGHGEGKLGKGSGRTSGKTCDGDGKSAGDLIDTPGISESLSGGQQAQRTSFVTTLFLRPRRVVYNEPESHKPSSLSSVLSFHPSHARGRQFIRQDAKLVGKFPLRRKYKWCWRLVCHDGWSDVIASVGLGARWVVRFQHALQDGVDVSGWDEAV